MLALNEELKEEYTNLTTIEQIEILNTLSDITSQTTPIQVSTVYRKKSTGHIISDEKLKFVHEFINGKSADEIAEEHHVGPTTIYNAFKDVIGLTIKEYRNSLLKKDTLNDKD